MCVLVLSLMHWQKGSDIESKGDLLSSCAECRIRTLGFLNRISNRLNARGQTDQAIEDQTKSLLKARTHDQWVLNLLLF